MGRIGVNFLRAVFQQDIRRLAKRASRVTHVVDDQTGLAFHIADYGHFRHFAGFLAPLVHDGQRASDPLCQPAGAGHAAHIWRHDCDFVELRAERVLDIQRKKRRGIKVVDRDVEEALNLGRVQVHGQHPLDPGSGHHVRDQLGRDRCPRLGAPVLARIAKIGHHCRDPRRRRPPQGVRHDQKFHQVVVRRVRR